MEQLNYYLSEIMDHVHNFNDTVKCWNDLAVKTFRMRYLASQIKNLFSDSLMTESEKSLFLQNLDFYTNQFEKLKNSCSF